MTIKSMDLAWIMVKDLKQAIVFYTEVVGLKLLQLNEEYGWAELSGYEGGMRLGIGQENDMEDIKAGTNAVITLTVADLDVAKKEMVQKGAKMQGDIIEIPGHVRMQSVIDQDGNHFQIVQTFY